MSDQGHYRKQRKHKTNFTKLFMVYTINNIYIQQAITYTSVAFITKAHPKVVGNNFMITADGLLDPTVRHPQLNRSMGYSNRRPWWALYPDAR
jgi:hypothetical protein